MFAYAMYWAQEVLNVLLYNIIIVRNRRPGIAPSLRSSADCRAHPKYESTIHMRPPLAIHGSVAACLNIVFKHCCYYSRTLRTSTPQTYAYPKHSCRNYTYRTRLQYTFSYFQLFLCLNSISSKLLHMIAQEICWNNANSMNFWWILGIGGTAKIRQST